MSEIDSDENESEKLESTISQISKFSRTDENNMVIDSDDDSDPLKIVRRKSNFSSFFGLKQSNKIKVDGDVMAKWANIFTAKKDEFIKTPTAYPVNQYVSNEYIFCTSIKREC